jgi:hypothetical protein
MAITGVVSLARSGETVRVFQSPSDLNEIFDPNSTPVLQPFDHVTLYPGDFTNIDPIEIKNDIYLTILPGAQLEYTFDLQESDRTQRLSDRYEHIEGKIENVADLNIAHLYETTIEKQLARVRRYKSGSGESLDDSMTPFVEYTNLSEAAEDAREGETIVVFPGDYNVDSNLLVDGVDWKFLSGATVTFEPDYSYENEDENTIEVYPHALFDDSKDVKGVPDSGSVEAKIYGKGEFIIGQTEIGNFGNGTETQDAATGTDWDNWHKYSLIALSNASSKVKFEAEEIKVKKTKKNENENIVEVSSFLDGVVKYTKAESLKINVNTLRFGSKAKTGNNVTGQDGNTDALFSGKEAPFPTFMIINGHNGTSLENELIDVNVKNVVVEEASEEENRKLPYLISGVNPNNKNKFKGKIKTCFENHKGLEKKRAIYFPSDVGHVPEKLLVQNSKIHGEIFFAGSSQTTKIILKRSEIYNSSGSPLILTGNSFGLDVSLSETWLLSNNAEYSIKNETGDTDFEIKAYQNSFANLPVQNFEQLLHDELNNLAWSEDVESISI